ncbi:MAG: AAA family ATPase, partial [Candidatus Amoebophilus sp.]
MLDFLAQAINKGTIQVKNSAKAKNWIAQHQHNIMLLQQFPDILTIEYINKLALGAKLLLLNINNALDNKLDQVKSLSIEDTLKKSRLKQVDLKEISISYSENKALLNTVYKKSSTVGLTTINILARQIDALNEKYQIVSRLKPVIKYGGLAIGGLLAYAYLSDNDILPEVKAKKAKEKKENKNDASTQTEEPDITDINVADPAVSKQNKAQEIEENKKNASTQLESNSTDNYTNQSLFKKISTGAIVGIKSWLGQKPDFKDKHAQEPENKDQLKVIGRAHSWISKNKDAAILGSILSTMATRFILPDLEDKYNNIQRNLSKYWEQLKGYKIPINDDSRYEVEETITLEDERLIGLESQIAQLKDLALYITEPDMFDRQGVSLGKGILLVGPTRCGKTLTARALAGTINRILKAKGSKRKFGFKEVKFSEAVWRNDGIKNLIEDARQNAPCVLFIDELHNLPLQSNSEFGNRPLNEFLTGMSGINSENDAKQQVIILGATNKPELLDSALLQPGRFGTLIHFEKPDFEKRKQYFNIMFKRNIIDSSQFDIDLLAQHTEGCSYGDLDEILRDPRFVARKQAKRLTQEFILDKIHSHVHRLRKELPLIEQEKKIVAAHQAGKALAHAILQPESKMILVSIQGAIPQIQEANRAQTLIDKNSKNIAYGH